MGDGNTCIALIENRFTFYVFENEKSKIEEVVIPFPVILKSSVFKSMVAAAGAEGCAGKGALAINGFSPDTVKRVVEACSSRDLSDLEGYVGRYALAADETVQLLRFFREFQFKDELDKLSTYHQYLKMRLVLLNSDVEMQELRVSSLVELLLGSTYFDQESDLLKEVTRWIGTKKLEENSPLQSWDTCWKILKHIRFNEVSPVDFGIAFASLDVPSDWKDKMDDYYAAKVHDSNNVPEMGYMNALLRVHHGSVLALHLKKTDLKMVTALGSLKKQRQHWSEFEISVTKPACIRTLCLHGSEEDGFFEVTVIAKNRWIANWGLTLSKTVRARKNQPILVELEPPLLLVPRWNAYSMEITCKHAGSYLLQKFNNCNLVKFRHEVKLIDSDVALNLTLKSSRLGEKSFLDGSTKLWWMCWSPASGDNNGNGTA